MKGPVSVYLLRGSNNFVREGPVHDVVSY